MWDFVKLIGAHTLKNYFFPALEVNIFKKLPQLVAIQIFQSSSVMRNQWTIIFYHVIIRLILNISFKALYISQKTPKLEAKILEAKILATKFGFVPDWSTWLGSQQFITQTNVDQVPCCHMVLLGLNELTSFPKNIVHNLIKTWIPIMEIRTSCKWPLSPSYTLIYNKLQWPSSIHIHIFHNLPMWSWPFDLKIYIHLVSISWDFNAWLKFHDDLMIGIW